MTDTIIWAIVAVAVVAVAVWAGVRSIFALANRQLGLMERAYTDAIDRVADGSQKAVVEMSELIQALADRLLLKSGVDPQTPYTVPQVIPQPPADGFAAMRERGLDPLNPVDVDAWESSLGGEV